MFQRCFYSTIIIALFILTECNKPLLLQTNKTPIVDFQKLQNKGNEAELFCKNNQLNADYCLLADMSMHSGLKRLFVWSFKTDTILEAFLIGHGCGDMLWSYDFSKENPVFSNQPNSHCSSLGKYKMDKRTYSNWGIHVKYNLYGLEESNSNAFSRQIVFHSWEKMTDDEVYPTGSPEGWGCPTVSNNSMVKIDKRLKASSSPVLLWMFQ